MAEFWYNDGAGVRKAKELYYNDGGGVRTIKEAWYNDGAGVRKVYASGGVVSPFTAWNVWGDSSPGVNASATLVFQSNGLVASTQVVNNLTTTGSANWYSPTTTSIGASYWIRATVTAGTISSGTTGSWLSIATSPQWQKGPVAGSGSGSATLTFDFSTDSGGSVIVLTSTGNVIQYGHT